MQKNSLIYYCIVLYKFCVTNSSNLYSRTKIKQKSKFKKLTLQINKKDKQNCLKTSQIIFKKTSQRHFSQQVNINFYPEFSQILIQLQTKYKLGLVPNGNYPQSYIIKLQILKIQFLLQNRRVSSMHKKSNPLHILFLACFITTTPYIIVSLNFLGQQHSCLSQAIFVDIEGDSYDGSTSKNFTLKAWLQILTVIQLSYLLFMGFNMAINWNVQQPGICSMSITLLYTLFNILFEYVWVMVGSIGYWGTLNSCCESSLNTYLYFLLISVYFIRLINVFVCHKFRKGRIIEINETDSISKNKEQGFKEQNQDTCKQFIGNQTSPSNLMESKLIANDQSTIDIKIEKQKNKQKEHKNRKSGFYTNQKIGDIIRRNNTDPLQNNGIEEIESQQSFKEKTKANVFDFFKNKVFRPEPVQNSAQQQPNNFQSNNSTPNNKSLDVSQAGQKQNIVEQLVQVQRRQNKTTKVRNNANNVNKH